MMTADDFENTVRDTLRKRGMNRLAPRFAHDGAASGLSADLPADRTVVVGVGCRTARTAALAAGEILSRFWRAWG